MKRIISFTVFCLAMAIAPFAQADVVLGPAATEGPTNEGTALGNFSNSVQTIYSQAFLAAAGLNVGDEIDGLAFRLNANGFAPVWSVADYRIALGTSANTIANLDPNFINNQGADYTLVRSGPLTYDGSEYPTGPGPTAFGETFAFNTNFTYTGGDLLLEYTHSPIVGGNSAADAFTDAGVTSHFAAGFNQTAGGAFGGFGGGQAVVVSLSVVSAVPEPSSVALLLGIGMVGVARRRRQA